MYSPTPGAPQHARGFCFRNPDFHNNNTGENILSIVATGAGKEKTKRGPEGSEHVAELLKSPTKSIGLRAET